ncbi:hypothetical protein [Plebeiibacterium marinum]|uniref:Uncharacterized protein n=1 Tax=Plebeiibacterium marinum TaxID=2992111 RepID=A0AAE3MF33_9BACT|nr:hypothetical protein [Plebeiobacterium marinum]MCW3806406.1 hypothetical protein [Plebeiobacterium marinum]
MDSELFETRIHLTISDIKKQLINKIIVKTDFYIDSENNEEFENTCEIIKDNMKLVFKDQIPAITFISQKPESNNELYIVCHTVNQQFAKVNFKKVLDHHYITIEHKNGMELLSGGISFNDSSPLLKIQRTMDLAEQILMAEEMNFGHIFRQWDYIPSIAQKTEFNGSVKTTNEIFNEVKSYFLEEALYKSGYPAVSNINVKNGNFTIDFMAFNNYEAFSSLNVESDYYLPFSDQGKLINIEKEEIWFSGSCLNFEPAKDVEKQILKCLQESFKLIEKDLVQPSNSPENNSIKANIKYITAYVKHESYNNKVRDFISQVAPDCTIVITNTEFYQKDKLVEIEGYCSH